MCLLYRPALPPQVSQLARSMSPRWAPPGVRFIWSLRPELRALIKPKDQPDPARVLVMPWVQQVGRVTWSVWSALRITIHFAMCP